MAKFETEGLEELEAGLRKHEAGVETTVDKILTAQAEIYVKKQQQAAESYGIKKTGGFISSIKAAGVKAQAAERYIDIAPEGRTDHGVDYGGGYSNKANKRKGKSQGGNVRYATIGYIFEYGTSSIPARPWATAGNEQAEGEAYQKAAEIWGEYVDSTIASK